MFSNKGHYYERVYILFRKMLSVHILYGKVIRDSAEYFAFVFDYNAYGAKSIKCLIQLFIALYDLIYIF